MTFRLSIAALFGGACIAGILCAQLICDSVEGRSAIGTLLGRGRLMAMVHDRGIYEADLGRELREFQDATRADGSEAEDQHSILSQLIADLEAAHLSRREKIPPMAVNRECDLLQFQIQPSKAWTALLHANGLSAGILRRMVSENLCAQQWLERQIANRINVGLEECLRYYQAHLDSYSQPMRFRASHLFLAAPPETPPEVVKAKRSAAESISGRILKGENFAELVALSSEDEATKKQGGDLGFFSESRMPPDFWAAIRNMQVGEISKVVGTGLGFHIIQLTDSKPGQSMTFDQARGEISLLLENRKRLATMEELTVQMRHQADFMRTSLPLE